MTFKGARRQGIGRGYMVCALRRLKHALVPVVGSNAIISAAAHFQTLPSRLQAHVNVDF